MVYIYINSKRQSSRRCQLPLALGPRPRTEPDVCSVSSGTGPELHASSGRKVGGGPLPRAPAGSQGPSSGCWEPLERRADPAAGRKPCTYVREGWRAGQVGGQPGLNVKDTGVLHKGRAETAWKGSRGVNWTETSLPSQGKLKMDQRPKQTMQSYKTSRT